MAHAFFEWNTVTKRLELEVKKLRQNALKQKTHENKLRQNYSILHISVVIDEQGRPIGWTRPELRTMEPQGDWILQTGLAVPIDKQ